MVYTSARDTVMRYWSAVTDHNMDVHYQVKHRLHNYALDTFLIMPGHYKKISPA